MKIGSERRDGEHRQHDRIQPEPGAPASLVAKFPGASEMGRHIGNLFDFYNREIRFYEEIAETSNCTHPTSSRWSEPAEDSRTANSSTTRGVRR